MPGVFSKQRVKNSQKQAGAPGATPRLRAMMCSQMAEVAGNEMQGTSRPSVRDRYDDKRFCFFCRDKRKKIKYNSENQFFTLDNILSWRECAGAWPHPATKFASSETKFARLRSIMKTPTNSYHPRVYSRHRWRLGVFCLAAMFFGLAMWRIFGGVNKLPVCKNVY